MNAPSVLINTDIGEGFGVWGIQDEGPLMDQVTAANIACGFHAGDPDIMRRTCVMAATRGVSIGAQVSYNDLAGFGRRFMDVSVSSLTNDIVYQIGALQAFASIAGSGVTYVKAHGALYNTAARHRGHASAIVAAVLAVDPRLPVLCQHDTILWSLAEEAGLEPYAEVFIDRGYTDGGLLVGRDHPQALLVDPAIAAKRALRMVSTGTVDSVTGSSTTVIPDGAGAVSLCVHSDTPGATEIAAATRKLLEQNDIRVVQMGGLR